MWEYFDVAQHHGDLSDAAPDVGGQDDRPASDIRLREEEPYSRGNRRPNLWVLWLRPWRGSWTQAGYFAAEDEAWDAYVATPELAIDVLVLMKSDGDPNRHLQASAA